MEKITKKIVDGLELPEKGQVFVWDGETKGFGVRLTAGGKSYFVQGRVNGQTRRVTIGKHGVFTVDAARKEAKEHLRDMARGIDPVVAKKAKKAAGITLKQAAENYKADKKTHAGHPLKQSTKNDIDKHMNKTFSPWKELPLASITRDMVRSKYKEAAKASTAQANQAFRILRAIYNWTREKSRAGPDTVLPENPVDALKGEWGHVPTKNTKIPAEKFGIAWNYINELRAWPGHSQAGQAAVDIIAFLLVTGCRFNEAATLKWDQVNLDEGYWRLLDPKNRQPVIFPLSTVGKAIIEGRPRINEYVFYGYGKKGYIVDTRDPMEKLSAKINERITPHDLRRSFVVAAGKAEVEFYKAKLLMNHKLSHDITVSAYVDKQDLRWLAPDIEKITQWIEQQARIAGAGNVVSIETKRRAKTDG